MIASIRYSILFCLIVSSTIIDRANWIIIVIILSYAPTSGRYHGLALMASNWLSAIELGLVSNIIPIVKTFNPTRKMDSIPPCPAPYVKPVR